MPRILVFDEHSVYRTGLRSLIGANIPGAEVIEANSLIQASLYIRNGVFDLMLAGIDLSSSALDPLKAARATSPTTRFAVISASDTRADILAILAAGFHGFISKHQSDTDILAAVSDILSGRIYVPSSVAEAEGDALGGRFSGEASPTPSIETAICRLTKRQRQVLALITRGRSNKEIASALDIAEATTKIHIAALLRTLGVRNRTEAAYKVANFVISTELGFAEISRSIDGSAASALEPTGVGSMSQADE